MPKCTAVNMALTVPNAMDTIDSAQKNAIVHDQEFLLQGSVLDASLLVVIDRLRGLCDNADIQPETFHDHEIVFLLKDFSGNFLFFPIVNLKLSWSFSLFFFSSFPHCRGVSRHT
ncbi:mediator of RNA polymerase II transcription subunit 18-like isoform X2 [Penaeus japonicus]|uniref:mediator of RNA polymerase II transcription subunit 18-like isoform X2 n=1 Tax=Penaeus japonicus TaxID=27405 RepID=UPI001C70BDB9|nr:mediator of RNA polymerase II transcription subunit 18-like isoform X2 [Penaeus japonicus]